MPEGGKKANSDTGATRSGHWQPLIAAPAETRCRNGMRLGVAGWVGVTGFEEWNRCKLALHYALCWLDNIGVCRCFVSARSPWLACSSCGDGSPCFMHLFRCLHLMIGELIHSSLELFDSEGPELIELRMEDEVSDEL